MIAVIDYGLGNLRSVSKALESLGADVMVTNNPENILKAKAVVLPGVGAFNQGMKNINKLKLAGVISDAIRERKPFLGICLGLQLLFTESEEHGISKGLDLIKGKVKRFTDVVKIPHMGWNKVSLKKENSSLFNDVPKDSYFYFVHSYYVQPDDEAVILGGTEYGIEFTSVINKDNIWAMQFHPEKSSDVGLKILKNFISLT